MSNYRETKFAEIWRDVCINGKIFYEDSPYFTIPFSQGLYDKYTVPTFVSIIVSMIIRKDVGLGRAGKTVFARTNIHTEKGRFAEWERKLEEMINEQVSGG